MGAKCVLFLKTEQIGGTNGIFPGLVAGQARQLFLTYTIVWVLEANIYVTKYHQIYNLHWNLTHITTANVQIIIKYKYQLFILKGQTPHPLKEVF